MERKRIAVALVFFIIVVLIMGFLSAEDVATEIQVLNTGPVLLNNIPNQSWSSGENMLNAFDLDDHFIDLNGDPINYSFSSVDNITLIINSLGLVSFYPDPNFTGIRNITFYASDGNGTAESNLVFLFVGADGEPPQWSFPYKNKINVYQSSYVNFSVQWTDNLQLKSYYFSIDQGAGWRDYDIINFSGVVNTSIYEVQISASPGSRVHWKFCASDANFNSNCSDIQNFSVVEIEVPTEEGGRGERGGGGGGYASGGSFSRARGVENFTVDPEYFKVSLKQGSTETRVLKITNIGNSELSFEVFVAGVEDLVVLSDSKFSILSGEVKVITLDFVANEKMIPEQYFGLLVIQSSETKQIPLIIDVNALELDFSVDVEVPEVYKSVMPGGQVVANISILNLKDVVMTNKTLYFALKDLYGNIYDSNQESIIFDSSLSLERNLTIPKDTNEGVYLFYARVFAEDALAIDSDIFEVGSRFIFLASLKYSFVFILIFVLAIVALFLMVVYSKSKEKERVLRLYLMLNELKKLIKNEEFEKATSLYIRIKRVYGEHISKEDIKNKEQLKEEIKKLSLTFKKDVKNENIPAKAEKEIKGEKIQTTVKKEFKTVPKEVKKEVSIEVKKPVDNKKETKHEEEIKREAKNGKK